MTTLRHRPPVNRLGRLRFDEHAQDWPNRNASQFVEARGIRWHVQRMGAGPQLLLLHGTGSTTHTWRSILPHLAMQFEVLAPDLPGHGFTDPIASRRLGLAEMAASVAALLQSQAFVPDIVVGHSAGAAILVRMALDHEIAPKLIISLNGAFKPFEGIAGLIYPLFAKLLFANPFAAHLFASRANLRSVNELIRGTGSRIDRKGIELYARLFSNTAHVSSVLAMMSHWNVNGLTKEMSHLPCPLALVVAEGDRAVPPDVASEIGRLVPRTSIERIKDLGHLMHEERPDDLADLMTRLAQDALASNSSQTQLEIRRVQSC